MRILIVGQYFWPENFRINEVATALERMNCRVSVLTGAPNYPGGTVFKGFSAISIRIQNRDGIRIHRVPLIPRGAGSAFRLTLNYLSFVVSACAIGPWLLWRQHFDVVLVYAPSPILQSIPGIWLGFIKRAKVVTWVQDLWPESLAATRFVRNRRLLGVMARVVRWIYRHNDLLLVPSRSFIDPVQSMAQRTPVRYLPNPGSLLPEMLTQRSAPALTLKPGFNVVFAGNLGTVQALGTVLDAAERTREYSDLWWVLIGSGSRSAWLSEQVERRSLRQVMLPGRFSPEAMPAILAQASALLVSLARDPIMALTVPSKIAAYLATGRPVIAALDGEGARIVTEAGAGLACAAEDSAALADAVLRLRAMPSAELEHFGESGRNYYRGHFAAELVTDRLLSCLRKATGGGNAVPAGSGANGHK